MSQLDILTSNIYHDINPSDNNYTQVMVDPASMIMIAGLIIDVVKMIKRCKTERETIQVSTSPTMFEKRVLYRAIKKRLTWREYFKQRNTIADAILNTGASMNEDEMFQLFEEVSD